MLHASTHSGFQKTYNTISTTTWYRRYKSFKIGPFFKIYLDHKNRPLYQKFFLFFYESRIKNIHAIIISSKKKHKMSVLVHY